MFVRTNFNVLEAAIEQVMSVLRDGNCLYRATTRMPL